MGKGCQPRKGHNPSKQRKNYDDIDWSPPSKLRKLTREQRRELAKAGTTMTASTYHKNPKEVLPDLVDLHEE